MWYADGMDDERSKDPSQLKALLDVMSAKGGNCTGTCCLQREFPCRAILPFEEGRFITEETRHNDSVERTSLRAPEPT